MISEVDDDESGFSEQDSFASRLSPSIVAAVVLPLLLAAGVVTAAFVTRGAPSTPGSAGSSSSRQAPQPLPLQRVTAPDADSQECRRLLTDLPGRLESGGNLLNQRELADPAPQAAQAWSMPGAKVEQAVVLRCGVAEPADLTATSQLQVVNGVQWLPSMEQSQTTFVAVDRPVTISLRVPAQIDGVPAGTGALQEVSTVLGDTLPQRPVNPPLPSG